MNRESNISYGGLVEGLTREDFFRGYSKPRNRELMRIFRDMDLVEQIGSGMGRILKVYDRSIFDLESRFLTVEFPIAPDGVESSDDPVNGEPDPVNGRLITELIRNDPHITYAELAEKTGVSGSTVKRIIAKLRKAEIIRRVGSDKSGYWQIRESL